MNNINVTKVKYKYLIVPLIELLDRLVPAKTDYWAFSVHHLRDGIFIENQRAVYEYIIKNNKDIQPIIFTREADNIKNFEPQGFSLIVTKIKSIKGLMLFIRCKVIFVTHSISMDYSIRWPKGAFTIIKINLKKHKVINLWHGISVKKLLALSNPVVKEHTDRVRYRRKEKRMYAGLVSSSLIDSYSMAAMFYPIQYTNIWITGLPRTDFLLRNINNLPLHLQKENRLLEELKGNKRLVVYAPTYRQTKVIENASYYQFTDSEIMLLRKVLKNNNAILGIRLHYFNNDIKQSNIINYIDDETIYDIGQEKVDEISPIIRNLDLLITDYSSVYIDALFLNKPVIGFIYDFDNYKEEQDGLLYNYTYSFPGPCVHNAFDLAKVVDYELSCNAQTKSERYQIARNMFFDYFDDANSERVVNRVRRLINLK